MQVPTSQPDPFQTSVPMPSLPYWFSNHPSSWYGIAVTVLAFNEDNDCRKPGGKYPAAWHDMRYANREIERDTPCLYVVQHFLVRGHIFSCGSFFSCGSYPSSKIVTHDPPSPAEPYKNVCAYATRWVPRSRDFGASPSSTTAIKCPSVHPFKGKR
jgi:hypothetical protein